MMMVFLQSGLIYIPLCVYAFDRNCMCVCHSAACWYRPDVHVNLRAEEVVLLLWSLAFPPQFFILKLKDSVQ